MHSALQPLGVHAQHLDVMWHTMLWVCGFMYLLVLAFLGHAVWRRRQEVESAPQARRMGIVLGGWIGLMVVGLFALALTSFIVDRSVARAASEPQVVIKLTAHQWWWEAEYTAVEPSRTVRTANELHVPVDGQVHIELSSADVIHSFWVPNLHGKQDM